MAKHTFAPTVYHGTIGSHEPVLRIASGDSVATTTCDAGGYDAAGERVADVGNAQTGPFFVEGAEPGDTLAMRLDSIRPNRDRAWAGSSVAPNVVDPDYVPELPVDSERGECAIDLERGTATLLR